MAGSIERNLPSADSNAHLSGSQTQLVVPNVVGEKVVQQVEPLCLVVVGVELKQLFQVGRERDTSESKPRSLKFKVVLVGSRAVRVEVAVTSLEPTIDCHRKRRLVDVDRF